MVGTLIEYTLLGETIGFQTLVGAVLIVAGLAWWLAAKAVTAGVGPAAHCKPSDKRECLSLTFLEHNHDTT